MLNNVLHFALKDWGIKYEWKPVYTGVILNAFFRADAFPSLLVHNLVWAGGTLILEASLNTADIKNSKNFTLGL